MNLYFVLSQGSKSIARHALWMISLLLFASLAQGASAITAEEVMRNVLKVYEDIDDYTAVVYTYKADSMGVSESVFESQQPIVTFKLFFRKPNEHAVEEIGKSQFGIFRIELLSALGRLKNLDVTLQGEDLMLGQRCHVLEISSAERPGEVGKIWISPKEWMVRQFSISIKSVELVTTRFRYPHGGRHRYLPMETRSLFPLSKQVLINRIANYEINTRLPSEIFKKRKPNGQSN